MSTTDHIYIFINQNINNDIYFQKLTKIMSIIPRNDFLKECRSVGREIEETVKNSTEPLTDENLNKVFEPIVTFIEEKTEIRIQKELEEQNAEREDKEVSEEKENLKRKRIANVSETVLISINGNEAKKCSLDFYKRIKSESKLLNEIEYKAPELELHDEMFGGADNDIANDSDDESFNQFIPTVNVDIDDKYVSLFNGSDSDLFKYLRKDRKIKSVGDMIESIEKIKASGFLKYNWDLNAYIQLLEIVESKF